MEELSEESLPPSEGNRKRRKGTGTFCILCGLCASASLKLSPFNTDDTPLTGNCVAASLRLRLRLRPV